MRDFLADARILRSDRDEVLVAIKDVQLGGLEVARHLRGDLYEVRAGGARASYRVLSAAEGARGQVLRGLSALSKKTQKTPPTEMQAAARRLADWRRRARR